MPQISVIVPVYNVEKYIHRCVDSILGQTYTDFELILVDDGSPDNCGTICDEYAAKDSRVVVIHQENGGLSAARNAGIDWAFANSDSQWLAFVDSDDWIHPQYLELLHSSATKHNTLIAGCTIKNVDSYLSSPLIQLPKTAVKRPEDIYVYKEGCCSGSFAVIYLYQKDLFQAIRYPQGRVWEDRATTYKLLFQTTHIATVEEDLYFYFYNPNSITKASWTIRNLDVLSALEENLIFFESSPYTHVMENTVKTYAVTLACQYGELQKSALDKKVIRMLGNQLKKKLLIAFWKYRKMHLFSMSNDSWILYMVFPKIMQYYSMWRAVLRKFNK